MAIISNLQDFDIQTTVPYSNFEHTVRDSDNSVLKEVSNTLNNTVVTVPSILAELRQDRKEAIKDVFEVIKLMDSYGLIQIKREEPVVVVENRSSTGKGFAIGVGLILLLGVILL